MTISLPAIFERKKGFWLDADHQIECAKSSKRSTRARMIVLHWTAAPKKTIEGNLDRICRWAADASQKSSTHFVILRDGSIWQLVSTELAAWHAGDSKWRCVDGTSSSKSVNGFSIGIDFDLVGPLMPKGDGFVDCYGCAFDGEAERAADGKWYEPPTEGQMWACRVLIDALRARYGIATADIVGHLNVSPGRKIDPGPFINRQTLGIE